MAAQYGTFVLKGFSGRTYSVDCYLDDTATNPVRFDGGAGATATSPTFWTSPELTCLIDVIIAAATGQTKTQLSRNNAPTGNILRNSVQLASVTVRPDLRIVYPAGSQIMATQLA